MTPVKFLLAALPLCAWALPAPAAPRCAPHDRIDAELAERFGEHRQAIALDGARQVREIFACDDTGGWTLLLTRPGGPSCLIAAGHAFEWLDPPPPAGDPAS
ncbi:hypothetical protein FHS00_002331 [Limimaricola variabilis]|uniref:Uncharacterized protein n=1 Tax=Limimaricola variabilis TaxID=1492771 RepID=A0ABR6HQL1_9RHOB|nr:hypothetical protein [Limimaricola variabilis]MBB3712736.1 hypothetical protein [Limimaricola variabilis]